MQLFQFLCATGGMLAGFVLYLAIFAVILPSPFSPAISSSMITGGTILGAAVSLLFQH